MIWAIDPGNVKSAYVCVLEDGELNPQDGSFGIVENEEMLAFIREAIADYDEVVIEMVASYGMPVGAETFETVYWIGRFCEAAMRQGATVTRIPRLKVKQHLCHDSRAKDANIRQALIDRFGVVGVKKDPGWFYGFRADIWAAYGLLVTYAEQRDSTSLAEEG